jgi:hypothetical protein
MNASMVPLEAASKHSKGGMIRPLGSASMRNRPPLISSTIVASRSARPWSISSIAGNAVGIRH